MERLANLLGARRGAVIAGAPGVGKTRLGLECMSLAAEKGFATTRVSATQATFSLPFGAYAQLLPEIASGTDRTQVLRMAGQAIVARACGRPVAVMVDDAHLLDESSAALTHQLAAMEDVFVIATIRAEEAASDAVIALWKDGLAERLELQPFSPDDVEDLLVSTLGGPVDGGTVHTFFQRTQGNVMFLKELMLGAVETGALVDEGGVWRLSGKVPASPRLIELVEARLSVIADQERDALCYLAIGEPLAIDDLRRLAGEVTVDSLERHRLVAKDEASEQLSLVRLAHPLYGDVLRAAIGPVKLQSVSRSLASIARGADTTTTYDALQVATWQLQSGDPADAHVMLAGARLAHARHDLELAERLARVAREAGGGFDAGLLLGLVASQLGRCVEAEILLAPLESEVTDDGQRAVLATTRIANLAYLGRTDEAIAVAEAAESDIEDPEARSEVGGLRTQVLYLSGRLVEAVTLAERLLPDASGRGLVMISLLLSTWYGSAGRLTEALAMSERGLEAYRAMSGPFRYGAAAHMLGRCEALSQAGFPSEAEAIAREHYEAAVIDRSLDEQADMARVICRTLLQQGFVTRATHWGHVAVTLCREAEPAGLRYMLGYLACVLAQGGRADEAEAAIREYEGMASTGDEFRPEALRAAAWIRASRGDLDEARGLLVESAESARDHGSFALESDALHDIARLGGATDVAVRLAELAETVEGPLAVARAAHVDALSRGDADALMRASDAFERMGTILMSAEAAADAAVVWRKRGKLRRAAATERRAHGLASRCEGARTPALRALRVRAKLSSRELEIAGLAASGLSNKDIAAKLVLSVRTVENTLSAAYEKLGVERRGDLAGVLDSSGSAVSPNA